MPIEPMSADELLLVLAPTISSVWIGSIGLIRVAHEP